MPEKKLFLLDGHALVYRAHYAFINRPLINSKGFNTSAITGFVRTMWDLMRNQNPTHIAVSFDLKGPTFRHKMYEPYKANRDAQPEDITAALPYIDKIVRGFNIPVVTAEGFEADDVIGTLAKQAEKEGFTVYMVTPDKDYAQLVSDNIFMYKPSRSGNGVDILGVPEVLEKWDIEKVSQVIDVLGLQGDASDNIPGIPGIGAKTASKLLKLYGDVEGLIANVDQLKGKQQEKVRDFADQGLLSKKLATIDLNVPVKFDAEDFKICPVDKPVLEALFKELEFRTLAQQILNAPKPGDTVAASKTTGTQQNLFGNSAKAATPSKSGTDFSAAPQYAVADKNITNTKHDYKLVTEPEDIEVLVKKLSAQKIISFDTETTGLDAHQAELVGLSFAFEKNKAYYIPCPPDRKKTDQILAAFKPLFANPDIIKIGQNIKYDITMLKWYDIEVNGYLEDTMIMHYLIEPDLRHKLDFLSVAYLEYKMVPIEDLIGRRGKNQLTMRDIDIAKVSEYAGEDADITFQVYKKILEKVKEEKLTEVYKKIEEPLISVLVQMEYNGVKINSKFLETYSTVLGKEIADKEKSIYKKAGVDFNIASPKQVGQVLFEKLAIPYRWRKTSTGQYSTDVEKLTELSVDHEIVSEILEYRKYAKLKSTYVDALPKLVNPRTGLIHSNFNQARAATGRLSSDNPNLQNIPIRDEAGREIRKAFIPRDKDHVLLAADYSQIELRLIAEISKDPHMMEAFIAGNDFHKATAARVYNVPYDEVTADQRRNAKTVNFSITYGAGATNLSRQLSISKTEAKELIDNYFAQFQGLKNYMDDTIEYAREHGYVLTMMGRKRKLRDINSRNGLARSNAERMAINTPIQGTAADMIKIAMIDIHKALTAGNYKTKLIMQVHDELVFDVPKNELEKIKPLVKELMQNAIPDLKVPILVEMDTGDNWLEAH